MTKSEILSHIGEMEKRNAYAIGSLTDRVSLGAYAHLIREDGGIWIWTDALQAAIREHEIVVIPPATDVYYMDGTVVIPSNRRIEAHGATIRLTSECNVLLFRNESTVDGTHAPITGGKRDQNISLCGGRWEESRTGRLGYGKSGKYDRDRSLYGVSTLFFFDNLDTLTLQDMTFAHTAGFAVQAGELTDGVFEHIRFDTCYADGIHLNGNTQNILCRDISGQVGDDLVALNVYDWQNSSVNFGPMDTVVCEDLTLSEDSGYKALRIEPGRYYFDDGTEIDCALSNTLIRRVRGIRTFKMYYQTPRYTIGTPPEKGSVGSADYLYFEDITADLAEPIDKMDVYMESDPIRGSIGVFELGANIGHITFENIDVTLHRDRFPQSYLIVAGPKSARREEMEIFDPYLSSEVGTVFFRNVRLNGETVEDLRPYIREVVFENINGDGHSTGRGRVCRVEKVEIGDGQ